MKKKTSQLYTLEILRIIRGYEQLYTNKLDNLEEMSKSLETQQHTNTESGRNRKLKQTRNSKKKKKKMVIFKSPTQKTQELNYFTDEFYQILKELMPILFKYFQTTEYLKAHSTRPALPRY